MNISLAFNHPIDWNFSQFSMKFIVKWNISLCFYFSYPQNLTTVLLSLSMFFRMVIKEWRSSIQPHIHKYFMSSNTLYNLPQIIVICGYMVSIIILHLKNKRCSYTLVKIKQHPRTHHNFKHLKIYLSDVFKKCSHLQ